MSASGGGGLHISDEAIAELRAAMRRPRSYEYQ
jgi:hypothetical protein